MNYGKKIVAGVVGDPISHSLSPRLHGYWLNKYKIKGEYKAFHISARELPKFLSALNKNKIRGVNLTLPHKVSGMALVDKLDESARKIGAINTIYVDKSGALLGSNTDGYGFLKNLEQKAKDWLPQSGPVSIIGAGGAARAIIASLLDSGVPEIRICNRTIEKVEELAAEINDNRVKVLPWQQRNQSLEGVALLVNVTTLGMTGQPPLELDLGLLPKTATVYDIVYNPLETALLANAKMRGNNTVDGLGMLLHQAVPGFKAWFGVEPEVDSLLRDHVLKALK